MKRAATTLSTSIADARSADEPRGARRDVRLTTWATVNNGAENNPALFATVPYVWRFSVAVTQVGLDQH